MASSDIIFSRNTSKDIIPQPSTLYTNSTTLTTGMILYDNTGTDTGKTIFQINQDGSFDVTPLSIVLSVGFQSNGGASEGVPTTTTINGDSITVPNSGSIDVTVNANESCTIVITTGNSGLRGWIYVNGTVVASNFGTITYTFTPTANCVVGVGKSYDPE